MKAVAPLLGAVGLLTIYGGLTGPTVARRSRLRQRIQALLDESGIRRMTPLGLFFVSLFTGMGTLFVVSGITSSLVVGVAFACITAFAPAARLRALRQRRLRNFQEVWPDAIATLIASI